MVSTFTSVMVTQCECQSRQVTNSHGRSGELQGDSNELIDGPDRWPRLTVLWSCARMTFENVYDIKRYACGSLVEKGSTGMGQRREAMADDTYIWGVNR